MKNTTNIVRTICEIGIFAALGFVFDELQGAIFGSVFPSGGSIGFAMIAVLIVAFRRGGLAGLLTGLIMGLFDIATKAYVIHPAQVLLDYVLPYAVVGLVGFLKPLFDKSEKKHEKILWLISGAVIGGMLKFLCHYFAGVFFWGDPEYFAWGLNDMNVYLYCFVYNIAFVGPSIVITGALLVTAFVTYLRILTDKPFIAQNRSNKKAVLPVILSSIITAAGLFLFIFFFVKWVGSFYYKESSQKYYFDQDSMVIYVIGIFFMALGAVCLVSYYKNKFNYIIMSSVLAIVTVTSLIYGISKLILVYVEKELDPLTYWIWFIVSLVGVLGSIAFLVISIINKKKKVATEQSAI